MILNNTVFRPWIIFLMGPTASGKTSLAIALKKQKLNIQIISVDSALIYRDMNIGTAKPSIHELKIAPHKLVNIRDPFDYYSISDFYYDAIFEIELSLKSGYIPLLVGGTMLYFKILLQGLFQLPGIDIDIRNDLVYEAQKKGWMSVYEKLKCIDPESSSKIHWNDHKRIIRALEVFLVSGKTLTELKQNCNKQLQYKYRVLQFAIMPSSREILNNRIEHRFYKMLESGFENEVNMLFSRLDLYKKLKFSCSYVGYQQMWEYLSGNIEYNCMILKGIHATRKLAKQQLTWLKRWPNIHWLKGDCVSTAIDDVLKILSKIFNI